MVQVLPGVCTDQINFFFSFLGFKRNDDRNVASVGLCRHNLKLFRARLQYVLPATQASLSGAGSLGKDI